MESLFDFSIISNFLSAIGINRTTYLSPELYVQPSGLKVTNQLIVELSKASKATKTQKGLFFKWIFVFLHCEHSPKLERWINKTLKPHDKLLKNKCARPGVLDCFYETIFTLPSDNPITSSSTDPVINLPSSPQIPKHVYKERVKGKCFDCESLRTQNEHLNQ